jgi:Fe-S-cluster containining protein
LHIPPEDQTLISLYAEADRLVDGWTCDLSGDCCRFDVTGREPYLWPNEWRLLSRAIAARGGVRRALRVLPEGRACPLYENGSCTVYEARPFGCRTFFCDRAVGPERRPPRAALAEIGRRVAAAAEADDPRAGGPRSITSWLRR